MPIKNAGAVFRGRKHCRNYFRADAKNIVFRLLAALNTRNMAREKQDCSMRNSDAQKCCAFAVKYIAVTILNSKIYVD